MKKLSNEDLNKRIAKFVGWSDFGDMDKKWDIYGTYKWHPRNPIPKYTDSINSMISPIAALKRYSFYLDFGSNQVHTSDNSLGFPLKSVSDSRASKALVIAFVNALENGE